MAKNRLGIAPFEACDYLDDDEVIADYLASRLSSELPKTPHTIGANAVKAVCAAAEPRPCIGNSVEN
jgi:hypothetical protein